MRNLVCFLFPFIFLLGFYEVKGQCVDSVSITYLSCANAQDGSIWVKYIVPVGVSGSVNIYAEDANGNSSISQIQTSTIGPDTITGTLNFLWEEDWKIMVDVGWSPCQTGFYEVSAPSLNFTSFKAATSNTSNDGNLSFDLSNYINPYYQLYDITNSTLIGSNSCTNGINTVNALAPSQYQLRIVDSVSNPCVRFDMIYLPSVQAPNILFSGNSFFTNATTIFGIDPTWSSQLEVEYGGQISLATDPYPVNYGGDYRFRYRYFDVNGNTVFASNWTNYFSVNGPLGYFYMEADTACYKDDNQFIVKEDLSLVDSIHWIIETSLGIDTNYFSNIHYVTFNYDDSIGNNPNYIPNPTTTPIFVSAWYFYDSDGDGIKETSITIRDSIWFDGSLQNTAYIEAYADDMCLPDTTKLQVKGQPGIAFNWDFGDGSSVTSSQGNTLHKYQGPGFYHVKCEVTTSCGSIYTVENDVIISVDPPFDLSTTSTDNTCGQTNGSAALVVNPPSNYGYLWSNGETTSGISNLPSGFYTVQVTDSSSGCVQSALAVISDLGTSSISSSITHVNCPDSSTGSITITNPSAFNSLLWSNGETSSSIKDLAPGVYFVSATYGSNNCSAIDTFEVLAPANPQFAATITAPSNCGLQNGVIDVDLTGGTLPYTWQWQNVQNLPGTSLSSNDSLIGGGGTYRCIVTDAKGCPYTRFFSNSDNVNFSVDIALDVTSCFGNQNITTVTTENIDYGVKFKLNISSAAGFSFDTTKIIDQPWKQKDTTIIPNMPQGPYTLEMSSIDTVNGDTCIYYDAFLVNAPKINFDPICLLTVNDDNNNVVVWEKPAVNPGLIGYNIYRNSPFSNFNNFVHAGFVGYDDLSEFTDPNSFADIDAYTYKITAVDSCNNESPLSPPHTAMHLSAYLDQSQAAVLTIKGYKGWPHGYVDSVYVFRNLQSDLDSFEVWRTIDSTSLGNIINGALGVDTLIDQNTFHAASYYVAIVPDPNVPVCQATKTNGNHVQSKSNDDEILFPIPFSAICTGLDETHQGNCDGELTAIVSGGIPPYSFQWNDPLNQNTQTADSLCSGSWTLEIVDDTGDTLIITDIVSPSSLFESQSVNRIIIYPNPAKEELYVTLRSKYLEVGQIRILDSHGRLLKHKNIILQPESTKWKINLENYSSGIYLVVVHTKQNLFHKKFVLRK